MSDIPPAVEEVYGDIPLSPAALGIYPHKPPPQQVVYHSYTPPGHDLYNINHATHPI